MYGVVSRNIEELRWPEFDRGFFEIKDVSGRSTDPVEIGTNMLSCFGDTARGEMTPEFVPVSADGERATQDLPDFDWSYICPTRDAYRTELFEMIERAVAVNDDLRIDEIGFPRGEYCHCPVCDEKFQQSEHTDRTRWRSAVITEFVKSVRETVPGKLSVSVYPDPYPGHLTNRTGVDLEEIEELVDELIVPLYDMDYSTTYWLEVIANGFGSRVDIPLSIELYAVDVPVENLVSATKVARESATDVLFGYDAGTGRAAARRLRAEEQDGDTYGTPGASS